MPRICLTCTHAKRKEIDRQLAYGEGCKRRIALKYGMSDTSLRRHEARHLDPALVKAHEQSLELEAFTARDVIVEAVSGLREDMRSCRGVHREQYMDVIDRLVRANEQYARINKELGADQLTAFFLEVGVNGKAEVTSRLEMTRGFEELSDNDAIEEGISVLRASLPREPHRIQEVRRMLDDLSYAEEVPVNGGVNGEPKRLPAP